VKQLLEERIAVAEERMNGASAEAPTPPTTASAQAPAASGARTIVVDVSLAPALAAQVDPDAPLFVLARTSGGGGPPLAVERHRAVELPLTVELSDEDAMVPGRNLSSAGDVEIVARVALGGQPVATKGDLYGSTEVAGGAAVHTHIEIDHVQQ